MASVRIFGYSGIVQIQQNMVKQFSSDSVFLLTEPYIWSQKLLLAGATPVSSTPYTPPANTPDRTTLLRIEVPDGVQIRYEVNPNGPLAVTARNAGDLSPRLSGFDQFEWGQGWTLSIVDAASFV